MIEPDDFVLGLTNPEPFTVTGAWDASTATITEHFTVKLTSPLTVKYSGRLIEFQAKMDDGAIRHWRLWYPVTDRRIARRIARRENMKFRRSVDGSYTFRSRHFPTSTPAGTAARS
jgi:hypothetical protein